MKLDEHDTVILKGLVLARKRGLEDGIYACEEILSAATKQNTPPTVGGNIIVDTIKMVRDSLRTFPQPNLEEVSRAALEVMSKESK